MSTFIVGCDDTYSIIVADTRITFRANDNEMFEDIGLRKLFYIGNGISWLGTYGTSIGDELFEKVKVRTVTNAEDVVKLFNESYKSKMESPFYTKNDLDSSIVFLNWITIEKEIPTVRLGWMQNGEKNIQSLSDRTLTLYPSDISQDKGTCFAIENLYSGKDVNEILTKYVEKFIGISENSNYVSEICCIGITLNDFTNIYYEGNMYELLNKLKSGNQLENRLDFLVNFQNEFSYVDYIFQRMICDN